MRIIDTRCGREFAGKHVDTIPAHSIPSALILKQYLGVLPGDSQYELHRAPLPYERLVIQHPTGYWVLPVIPEFYRVVDQEEVA